MRCEACRVPIVASVAKEFGRPVPLHAFPILHLKIHNHTEKFNSERQVIRHLLDLKLHPNLLESVREKLRAKLREIHKRVVANRKGLPHARPKATS